jgi:hypothetical protein
VLSKPLLEVNGVLKLVQDDGCAAATPVVQGDGVGARDDGAEENERNTTCVGGGA